MRIIQGNNDHGGDAGDVVGDYGLMLLTTIGIIKGFEGNDSMVKMMRRTVVILMRRPVAMIVG